MTTDLQAAVEQYVRYTTGDHPASYYGGMDADLKAIAAAYIADHPADSAEPVDESWLRSVGCTVQFRTQYGTVRLSSLTDETPGNAGWLEATIRNEDSPKVRFVAGDGTAEGAVTIKCPTRQQARLLCHTLGIPLLTEARSQ